jgi:hypothetical protein
MASQKQMIASASRIYKEYEMFVTTEPQEDAFVLRIESDEIRLAVYLYDSSPSQGKGGPERIREVVTTFIDIFLAYNPGEAVVMLG